MEDYSKSDNFKDFIDWYHQVERKAYPKPSVTADCLLYTLENNQLQLLLIQRKYHPFKHCFCLPGGFCNKNESVEETCIREMKEETSLDIDNLQQVGFFSKENRDLRDWIMTCAFHTFMYPKPIQKANDDALQALYFDIEVIDDVVYLSNKEHDLSYNIDLIMDEDYFYEELSYKYQLMLDNKKVDSLAFDHDYIIKKSIRLLQNNQSIFEHLDDKIKSIIYKKLEIEV